MSTGNTPSNIGRTMQCLAYLACAAAASQGTAPSPSDGGLARLEPCNVSESSQQWRLRDAWGSNATLVNTALDPHSPTKCFGVQGFDAGDPVSHLPCSASTCLVTLACLHNHVDSNACLHMVRLWSAGTDTTPGTPAHLALCTIATVHWDRTIPTVQL